MYGCDTTVLVEDVLDSVICLRLMMRVLEIGLW